MTAESHDMSKSRITVSESPKINPFVTNSIVLIEGLPLATFRISSYRIKAAMTVITVITGLMEVALANPIAVTNTIMIEMMLSILATDLSPVSK
jgi:uncharacterized membrane protein